MPKLFITGGENVTIKTQEIRYRISQPDMKVFDEMAEQDILQPGEFLVKLIRAEAERRNLWPPQPELTAEGEIAALMARQAIPDPEPVLLAKRDKR